ncbi:MAG TPA: biotin/lipoyl-containing protein, partial [Bryobacteraceae bacterium]
MPHRVIMPALELGQETGKLVAWRKKEGQNVSLGELILDVETDKAVVEIEAPADGVLAGINTQAGEEVPVGRTIAWIVGPGEQVPSDGGSSEVPANLPAKAAPVTATAPSSPAPVRAGARISPKARRLAKEKGVEIGRLQGSGPGGEILAADILAALADPPAAAPAEKTTSIARLMAERTAQSWTTVPHFFLVRQIAATPLLEARERLLPEVKRAVGVRLTHTDLLLALVAKVLAKHSEMNASWSGEGIRHNS